MAKDDSKDTGAKDKPSSTQIAIAEQPDTTGAGAGAGAGAEGGATASPGATLAASGPTEAPRTAAEVRAIVLENDALRSAIVELQQRCAAYEELLKGVDAEIAAAKAAKKIATGDVVFRALVPVLGNGRRTIAVGERLSESELPGLEQGKHFERVEL